MFLDFFKKFKLDYLSDGSLLRYSSRLSVYYFFCEHFPLEVIIFFLLFFF